MVIALDIIWSVLLLAVGFVVAFSFLKEEKLFSKDQTAYAVDGFKILCLVIGVISFGAIIVTQNITYKSDLVEQIKLITLVGVLFPTAIVDYKIERMPNKFLLAGLILRILIFAWECIEDKGFAKETAIDGLLGAAILGVFFLLLLLIFRGSICMGDVKTFALIGFYQGMWAGINSVFFSLVVCFFVSILLLATKKKTVKDAIPFGPSILLGTALAICLAGI